MKRYIKAAEHTKYNLNVDAYYDLADLLNTISDNCDELWSIKDTIEDDTIAKEMSEYLGKISSNIQLAQIRWNQL